MKKLLLLILLLPCLVFAQQKNKAVYSEGKSEYWEEIEKAAAQFNAKETPSRKQFKVDFTGMNLPKSKDEFKTYWHNDPINQGITGTCWSFATTSYMESEIYRLHNKKIKLSEMFNAYWEYVEKARGFVQSRGKSNFGEGSESNAVRRIWKKYGAVPAEAYSGKLPGQKVHDHSKMFDEMNNYLKSVKQMNAWNEQEVTSTIIDILNSYMGKAPEKFTYEGKTFTPKEFLEKEMKLDMDSYVDIMSLMESPYYTMAEYKVPDNWWHSKEYFNVPLDDYMNVIKNAIRKGYTVCIGGDVSEPGIDSHAKVAIVPTFDVPSEYIDESARQFRFVNETSTDDHLIHIVGYETKDGKDWFLIKDSGSGAFNVGDKGYYYYNEDYIKLKVLICVLPKEALGDLGAKLPK